MSRRDSIERASEAASRVIGALCGPITTAAAAGLSLKWLLAVLIGLPAIVAHRVYRRHEAERLPPLPIARALP